MTWRAADEGFKGCNCLTASKKSELLGAGMIVTGRHRSGIEHFSD